MGPGGLVTIIPNMSDIDGKQQIAGQCQEWVDRLDVREATDYPKKEEWGSDDPKLVKYWADRSFFSERLDRVVYSVHVDAEILKCVLNDMVEEAGVKTYLHSWGTQPIMEGDKVRGVIFIPSCISLIVLCYRATWIIFLLPVAPFHRMSMSKSSST